MKARKIALILIPLNIILAYFVFDNINSQIKFNQQAKERIAENVQKLKDLRQLQIKYRQAKGEFADNFEKLNYFLQYEQMAIVNATGEIPDSLINGEQISESLAIELGLTIRDTTYILAKESVFDAAYLNSRQQRFPLNVDMLKNVPHSNLEYNIEAGEIEKGNVIVKVFEISTNYKTVFTGLDAKNKSYELDALLKVGSMTEASLNGNWKNE